MHAITSIKKVTRLKQNVDGAKELARAGTQIIQHNMSKKKSTSKSTEQKPTENEADIQRGTYFY